MFPVLLAAATFASTFLGGLFAFKNKDRLHRVLGYTAGVVIGLVAFDLLPELFELISDSGHSPVSAMVALVAGFLAIHVLEKSILLHKAQESDYGEHHHPHVGKASALALAAHSFLDGFGIGLAFQVGEGVGIAVAIAVIAHDFSDGINTVGLMLAHKNNRRDTIKMLVIDALAPILGAACTLLFNISEQGLIIYLGVFTGFLLYIGASEILPEAHSKHSSYKTIGLTVLGVIFMFVVTRFL